MPATSTDAGPRGVTAPSAPTARAGPGTGPPPPAERAPVPAADATAEDGVYVYATNGYEATDALGGSRHDYPQESAVTLRNTPCGWVQRWEPLAERWDESELCREGEAVAIRRFTTYHEFFQRGQRQDFTCPAGSHVARPAAPGEQWQWECTWGSSKITTVVTFIGNEPFHVGGRVIEANRFLYESRLTGSNRGTQRQERWLHAKSGLNLRITTDIDTEADSPFGAVRYEEHYTITLSSLRPRR